MTNTTNNTDNTYNVELVKLVAAHEAARLRLSKARRSLDDALAVMDTAQICGNFFPERGNKERLSYLRAWSAANNLRFKFQMAVAEAEIEVNKTLAAAITCQEKMMAAAAPAAPKAEKSEDEMHAEVMAIINNPSSSEAERARARAWLLAA